MKEAQLHKKSIAWLNKQPNTVAWKIHGGPSQRVGIPDILACVCGSFLGIELKASGKLARVTRIQQHSLDRIEGALGISGVADSFEEVQRLHSLAVRHGRKGKKT